MNFNSLFKEYYYLNFLSESQRAKYLLIERYGDRVSNRLLEEKAALMTQAKKMSVDTLKELQVMANPFISMAPKDDFLWGCNLPVPFKPK